MRNALLSLGFALSTALAACSPPPPTACVPSCREGFSCVSGACVSSCNPACAAGERCDTSGGRTRCVAASDGGSGSDGATVNDSGSALDSATETDSSVAMDTGVVTDTGVATDTGASSMDSTVSDTGVRTDGASPTDSGSVGADAADARPSCGAAGQPCCGRYCAYGSTCEIPTGSMTGTCVAFTPVANECVGTMGCAMPAQRCGVGYQCGERRCNLCMANAGTLALGAVCTSSAQCDSAFCFGGRCVSLCTPGAAGDMACAAMLPGGVCGGGSSSLGVMPEGGAARSSVLSFGACRKSCSRPTDCAAGEACSPTTNEGADRVDFLCRSTSSGLAGGAACASNAVCASGSCVFSGMSGVCFAPCVTNADCPASAPMCVDLTWTRPSGGAQTGRACVVR